MQRISISTCLIILVLLFISCKKNSMMLYDQKPAVYFSSYSNQMDSLVYSLNGKKDIDTQYVVLSLRGKVDTDKKFKVVVNPATTTAQEGLHYKKLEEYYTFSAGKYSARIPIVLLKDDPDLSSRYFTLGLKIVNSEEIDAGYADKLNARIIFTNQLTRPSFWLNGTGSGNNTWLYIYFGAYSKAKHEVCIAIMGHNFPATAALLSTAPYSMVYWQAQGRKVWEYLRDHDVRDENGVRILADWNPL